MIHLHSNNKQQVVTDGNPYLCEDCILGRPIERLDVQVLLDPFEESLDSLALSVQFCNGNCFKREVIRQESIHYVLRKVLKDTPVLLLVHVGKSGSGHHLQTGMIQLGVESSQLSLYATKACAAGHLSITHDKKLVTASESSCMKIPSTSVNTFPEFVVRDERHQLREYSISGIHILCYLIYETVQRYKSKSENFKISVSYLNLSI